jgi:signal peptidase I
VKKSLFKESLWVLIFILFFGVLYAFVLGFYLIPSPSMMPSIVPGDRVVLNKLSYGIRLPFQEKPMLTWNSPLRGDIVFFASPNGQGTYIKRIIGLPGDVIRFKQGVISVNGLILQQRCLKESDNGACLGNILIEENRDLHLPSHPILISEEKGATFFEYKKFIVPPGKFFVLGDNRDQSVDSRVFGFVEEFRLYGKAVFVLFSTEGDSRFFPKFRIDRFFKGT